MSSACAQMLACQLKPAIVGRKAVWLAAVPSAASLTPKVHHWPVSAPKRWEGLAHEGTRCHAVRRSAAAGRRIRRVPEVPHRLPSSVHGPDACDPDDSTHLHDARASALVPSAGARRAVQPDARGGTRTGSTAREGRHLEQVFYVRVQLDRPARSLVSRRATERDPAAQGAAACGALPVRLALRPLCHLPDRRVRGMTMDWVCGHTWKAYVSNSAFFGSMSVGVIVFGAISDKIGRVPVMVVVYVLAGIGAVATHFAQDFLVFLATRVIEGSVLLSISTIPFVLALEYVPAQKRMLMLSAFRFVYPLLGAAMPWVAYALAHWRLLNAVIMFPCFVGTIASIFTPESTRWLLSKGKTDKAKKILLRIGRINGKRVEKSAIDTLQPSDKSESAKSSTVDIFKYPSLRKSFVITLILWVMSCLAYQAGQLYASLATDNPFVVSSTTNAVDILAIGLAVPLADKWGRRPSTASAYAFAGLCYLAVAGFYGKSAAIFAALMAGRFALTAAYNVGYLYAAEIYPTEIRSQALSVRQAFGSLGKFLSSQVVQLVRCRARRLSSRFPCPKPTRSGCRRRSGKPKRCTTCPGPAFPAVYPRSRGTTYPLYRPRPQSEKTTWRLTSTNLGPAPTVHVTLLLV
ncbi:hypothetical protein V5799_018091 [Amblyomma americanum]|uniref:Major facilitator superfamily (MFS) profile domain-containing protein n=1 Tax=Amblyomma americanum TaxID=6943 RepID=A0AAQ4F0S1_AMBAM